MANDQQTRLEYWQNVLTAARNALKDDSQGPEVLSISVGGETQSFGNRIDLLNFVERIERKCEMLAGDYRPPKSFGFDTLGP